MAKVPFCGGEIEVGAYVKEKEEFRIMLAQIEVLGEPYLDALEKQGIKFDADGQMRELLKHRERYGI